MPLSVCRCADVTSCASLCSHAGVHVFECMFRCVHYLCVFVYDVYMYVYLNACACTFMCVYLHVCLCMLCVSLCACVHLCICVCILYVYVCSSLCVYMGWICVCICVCVCIWCEHVSVCCLEQALVLELITVGISWWTNQFNCISVGLRCFVGSSEQSAAEFQERCYTEVLEQIKAAVWTASLTPHADMKLVLLTLLLLLCSSQGKEPSLHTPFWFGPTDSVPDAPLVLRLVALQTQSCCFQCSHSNATSALMTVTTSAWRSNSVQVAPTTALPWRPVRLLRVPLVTWLRLFLAGVTTQLMCLSEGKISSRTCEAECPEEGVCCDEDLC